MAFYCALLRPLVQADNTAERKLLRPHVQLPQCWKLLLRDETWCLARQNHRITNLKALKMSTAKLSSHFNASVLLSPSRGVAPFLARRSASPAPSSRKFSGTTAPVRALQFSLPAWWTTLNTTGAVVEVNEPFPTF